MGGICKLEKVDSDTIIEYRENWSVEPVRIRVRVFKLKVDFGDQDI